MFSRVDLKFYLKSDSLKGGAIPDGKPFQRSHDN